MNRRRTYVNPEQFLRTPPDVRFNTVKRITLVGGIGDGQQMLIPWGARWLLCDVPSRSVLAPHGIEYEQYSPDANGVWRPIGQYHQHYQQLGG